ncbi:hypothetical protein GGR56DRAFT_430035 [Xylariaceae sp. FL0804]|nr:hypothetical protein GGR56DRAFT_430035 [Xylariaceae sp. FL0804]
MARSWLTPLRARTARDNAFTPRRGGRSSGESLARPSPLRQSTGVNIDGAARLSCAHVASLEPIRDCSQLVASCALPVARQGVSHPNPLSPASGSGLKLQRAAKGRHFIAASRRLRLSPVRHWRRRRRRRVRRWGMPTRAQQQRKRQAFHLSRKEGKINGISMEKLPSACFSINKIEHSASKQLVTQGLEQSMADSWFGEVPILSRGWMPRCGRKGENTGTNLAPFMGKPT